MILGMSLSAFTTLHVIISLIGIFLGTTVLTALYFNVFVLVVQAFLKIPVRKSLAPQQDEPPFLIAQIVVLVAFLVLGFRAVKSFRPAAPRPAAA